MTGTAGPSAPPQVSVVIPTHNRAGMVTETLRALGGQEDAPPFEVIVVDDASTDDTQEVLRLLADGFPVPLIALRQPTNRGPATARNQGWRSARGDIVCFTDDDCVPQPGWLAALVDGLGGHDIAQGRTIPNPDQRDRWGPFSHTVEILTEAGFYETCNVAYRRSWLQATGGFDEDFLTTTGLSPFGEDTDLAWRVKAQGARSVFVPDALVHHEISESDFTAHLRLLRRRSALVHLIRLHPEARALFPGPWYHKRTHPPALGVAGAALALAARPRSPWRWLGATAALAAYTRVCLQTWRGPRRMRQWAVVIPLAIASDLIEIAILADASVREGTFFL